MANLSRVPIKMLGDLVSPRALERIVEDAAQSRGKTFDTLDIAALEDILKREVFKRLQLSVPASLAKKRVSEVLDELAKTTQERALPGRSQGLFRLDDATRRFSLYFDWPNTQRLRGVLNVARQEEKQGRDISALIQEGDTLIAQIERQLEEELVAQAQDLAELQAAFRRVQGMGSREVRRLETLIGQIDDAQKQGMLLPAEVERARGITFKLRKSLESSVVQPLPGGAPAGLDPEAQARVLALEQEHAAQALGTLERDYAALLLTRPELGAGLTERRAAQQAGTLTSADVDAWRGELAAAQEAVLTEQRAEFERLLAELAPAAETDASLRVLLDATRNTLGAGGLVTDGLRELRAAHAAQGDGADGRARLAAQQELLEIERSARNVPGALAELSALIGEAEAGLARGEAVDLGPLWAVLERHLGSAAQEREDFDARADHVIREYDTVRTLAGETTQRLGRLADTLRAQRRLGPMSAQARERYAQTLEGAEALLAEAHAEFRAAQEVTATFGEDALSGLLDVFDLGGPGVGSLPVGTLTPDDRPDFGGLLASLVPAPTPGHRWEIRHGALVSGEDSAATAPFAALLAQADALGLHRLDMADAGQVWSARRGADGTWRLARAPGWDALEREAGAWLDGGAR